MAITAAQIIDYATILLQDTGHKRWTEFELLTWLNIGQDQVVALKPESSVVTASYLITPNQTKQMLPNGTSAFLDSSNNVLRSGLKLIDIIRNLGRDGNTPGNPVSIIDRTLIDQASPDWHYSNCSDSVQHFVYSSRNPRVFYVIPYIMSNINAWIELVYIAKPTRATTVSSLIDLPDEYETILLDYILFRAFAKSTDGQLHLEKARAYYESFRVALHEYGESSRVADPNNTRSFPSPSLLR